MTSNGMHPHWQPTDGDFAPTAEHVAIQPEEMTPPPVAPSSAPSTKKSVSRQPAAFTGMLIAIGVGFGFFYGVQNLTGQLGEDIEIHISDDGFSPSDIVVFHGQDITLVNDTSNPQQLAASNWPCQSNTDCLSDLTLAPGSTNQFTVPEQVIPGTYSIGLNSDTIVSGTITVADTGEDGAVVVPTTATNTASPTPLGGPVGPGATTTTVAQANTTIDTATSEEVVDSPAAGSIPQNPYTIGTESYHSGAPLNPEPILGKGKGPTEQPKTGAGSWIVTLCALAALVAVLRISRRRHVYAVTP